MATEDNWRDKLPFSDSRAAAPSGLQQQQQNVTPGPVAKDPTGTWRDNLPSNQSATGQPRWQTGGQYGSLDSGWDTPFYRKMFEQQEKHYANNTLSAWYSDSDYTGIATWNGSKDHTGRAIKAGDVYQDGKFQGSILDRSSGYSEDQAYAILGQLTLDAREQREAYKRLQTDPTSLRRAVGSRIEQTSNEVAAHAQQQAYQSDVDNLKEDWDDGWEGLAVFSAGFGGGAALGTTGLLAGPVAGALTMAGAGLIGGFSALLNRDTLVDSAARASVQTGMAAEQFGAAGAFSTGLRQWSAAGLQAASPLNNLVQGTTDAVVGEIGDDRSEYYSMEDRPAWLTALSLGATLGDSLLQFANPAGQAVFMGSMTSSVLGGVGQLATQGGATFDDRRGAFHSPENVGQWAAAVGAVGIDAIQLGLGRGIIRAAQNADDIVLGGVINQSSLFNRALPAGAVRTETIGARKFYLDAAGNVVGSPRTTFTVLAPSEATMWASSRMRLGQEVAKSGGAVSKEQAAQIFYNASRDLAQGTNLAKTALLNAFGEGAEEAAQQVLEPLSHGWAPDPNEVMMAWFEGAAAGAGMSIGARVGRQSREAQSLHRINQALRLQGSPEITMEQLRELSPEDRTRLLSQSPIVDASRKEIAARLAREAASEVVQSDVAAIRFLDAGLKTRDQELRNLNPALEGTFTIGALASLDIPNHVVQTDIDTVVELIQANADALLNRVNGGDQAPGLTELSAEAQRITAELTRQLTLFHASAPDAQERIIAEVNDLLTQAWNQIEIGEAGARALTSAKAVSVLLSRSPNNSRGSFQMMLPQASLQDSLEEGRGLLKVSQAVLEMINGDFDGDMMRQHVRVAFEENDDAYRAMRLGLNSVGTRDGGVKIGTRAFEDFVVEKLATSVIEGGAAKQAAESALTLFEGWMRKNFATISNIDEIVDTVLYELSHGVTAAKQNLFKALNLADSDGIVAIGERGSGADIAPFSNPYMAIDQKLASLLHVFAESQASRYNQNREFSEVKPVRIDSTGAARASVQAATLGATMHQMTTGNDPFRAPQHLKYADQTSPTEAAGQRSQTEFDRMAMLYQEMSSGIGQTIREGVLAKNEIVETAFAMLRSIARANGLAGNGVRSEIMLAGLKVPNFTREGDSFTDHGGYISLGQYALREASRRFQHMPEYEDKVSLYASLEPAEALVEIFDAYPLLAAIGEAAYNWGPQMTVGQAKTMLLQKDGFARRDLAELFRSDIRYNKDNRHDLPYSMDEALGDAATITDYHVVVDALLAAADRELSSNPRTGEINPNSRLWVRDQEIQASFERSIEMIQVALHRFQSLYGMKALIGRKGKFRAQEIFSILDKNPELGRAIMELLPQDTVNIFIAPRPDGKVAIRRALVDMLMLPPKQAAMRYFRHVHIAKLDALANEKNPRATDDRMVELHLQLQLDPTRRARFEELLATSEDLTEFINTVNKEYNTGAPQLAWFRDVAMFDPSRGQGGWSKALPGTEMREAVRNLERTATAMQDYAAQEQELDQADGVIITLLTNALDQVESGRKTDSETYLQKMQQQIQAASELRPALGPATLLRSVYGGITGFMADMTDKGKGAAFYETLANIQALGYSPLQSIGYMQHLGAMTAWDADDAAANPGYFAGHDLRLADRAGRIVEWTGLSNRAVQGGTNRYADVRELVTMWKDPANRPMLRAMLFPTAFEAVETGGMSQQLLTKMGLSDLLGESHEGTVYQRMLGSTARADRLRLASQIDAQTGKFGKPFGIQRLGALLGIARAHNSGRTLGPDAMQSLASDAVIDITNLAVTMAGYRGDDAKQVIRKAIEKAQQTILVDPTLPENVREAVQANLFTSLVPEAPEGMSEQQAQVLTEKAEIIQKLIYGKDALLEQYAREYLIDWRDEAGALLRMQKLQDIVLNNPGLQQTAIVEEMGMILSGTMMDATGTVRLLSANPETNRDRWDAVARGVLMAKFAENVTGVISTRVATNALPSSLTYENAFDQVTDALRLDNLGYARLMDSSYSYLLDDLLDDNSAIMRGLQEFKDVTHGSDASFPAAYVDDLQTAVDRVLNPEKLGRWVPEIMRQSVDALQRIDSSGASRQISSSGILYAKYAALIEATKRTFRHPEEAGVKPREYVLDPLTSEALATGRDINPLQSGGMTQADGTMESISVLNGRALTGARVIYRTADGVSGEADLFTDAAISPTHEFQGSAAARRQGLGFTSLKELHKSLNSILPANAVEIQVTVEFYHPADQPTGPDWANNLFFEGTVLSTGDSSSGLLSELVMGIDGLNVTEEKHALKANRRGTLSLINPDIPTLADIRELEAAGGMYEILRAKTLYFLGQSMGHDYLDPEYYNAVFKDLKMRHGFRAIVEDGTVTLLSSDEAIAMQQRGETLEGTVELVTLSPRTINTLLGEQDVHGLHANPLSQLTVDSTGVRPWTGSLQELAEHVPGILDLNDSGSLENTRVMNRNAMSQGSVRPPASQEEIQLYRRRIEKWATDRIKVDASRQDNAEHYQSRKSASIETLLGDSKLLNRFPQMTLYEMGLALDLPVDANPQSFDMASRAAFSDLLATSEAETFSTSWTYLHKPSTGRGSRIDGVLQGFDALGARPDNAAHGERIVHRDLVLVELDSFPQDPIQRKAELIRVMHRLSELGATIALVDREGDLDSRMVSPADLDRMSYRPVPGTRGLFVPFDPSSRQQTLEAIYSRYAEVKEIEGASFLTVFHSSEVVVEESAAIMNKLGEKSGREIGLSTSLAPSTAYGAFGIAETAFQRELVQRKLTALASNEAAIDHLVKLADTVDGPKKRADARRDRRQAQRRDELKAALQRAAENYDVSTGLPSVGSDFGPGDIRVFIGPQNKLILERFGHEAIPDLTNLSTQLATVATDGPGNIAIYGNEMNQEATTFSGKILGWRRENGYGWRVQQAVKLSELGNKGVSQLNGVKLITSSDITGSDHELPSFGFMQNWDVDLLTHMADTVSKENYDGMINTAQNAIGYLGMDFAPAYAQGLFGVTRPEWDAMSNAQQLEMRGRIENIFNEVSKQASLSAVAVKGLQRQVFQPDTALDAALATIKGLSIFTSQDIVPTALEARADQRTPQDLITIAALIYMQYRRSAVVHVMGAAGMDGVRVSGKPISHIPPELFTGVLDTAPMESPLRTWFFDELNARLNNAPALETGSAAGYHLGQDWKFTIMNDRSEKNLSGYIQFAEFHSSGHNSILKEQSRLRNTREDVSRQQTLLMEQTLNVSMHRAKDLTRTQRFLSREGVTDISTAADVLGILDNERLRKVPTYTLTRQLLPAERAALEVQRDARLQFQQEIDESEWTDAEKAEAVTLRNSVVLDMGLTEEHARRVDPWVRAWLGAPAADRDQDANVGWVSFSDFKDAIQQGIKVMLAEGRYPIDEASMTQMSLNDVIVLARAAESGRGTWKLRGSDGAVAKSLEDFVYVALNPDRAPSEGMFQTAADGMFNTFRELGDEFSNLPVSMDEAKLDRLYDVKTQQLFLSMDPSRRMQAEQQDVGGVGVTLSDIFGGTLKAGRWRGEYPPSSGIRQAQKRRAEWMKKHNVPESRPQTLAQQRVQGRFYVHEASTTNAAMRVLLNVRGANGMFNPWLFASQPLESGVKNSLENIKNLLTGESTGALGQTINALSRGRAGNYSIEIMQQKEATANAMGSNRAFRSLLNSEFSRHPKFDNAGPIERFTAKMQDIAGTWQDATWGMRQTTLARRYLDSVMSNVAVLSSQITLTPQELLTNMQENPEWVLNNHPELHSYAMNRIANIRSLKPTTWSLLVGKGFVDPLTTNGNPFINIGSTLALKLPLYFFNFAANQATNMLGLQGLNAVSAVVLNSPGIKSAIGRGRALLMGQRGEYNPAKHDLDFVKETIEHADLADAFIQSGLTHSGLMALGLITGSLGLTGGDEEDRRRRRAAQMQGAGYVYDPREIENDWRNADALYLDNLPDWFPFVDALREMYKVGVDQNGDTVSMVQMHWVMKQFISPLMGISNFIDTGNFQHVVWGFEDALGAMPLVNQTEFDTWTRVAVELQQAAIEAEGSGNPDALPQSFGLLLNGVMGLERMLMENSFVNSLYAAMDEYDRDPYKMVDIQADGTIARDKTNNAQRGTTLQDRREEDGSVATAYMSENFTTSQLKALSENRLGLALMLSLIPGTGAGYGLGSEFLRTNMAIKTRSIEQEQLDTDEATSIILSMWDPNLNREVLTDEGGLAVIKGLQMGTVRPGDAALDNVYLDFDQRKEIQERLEASILQDFLDMGLDKETADDQLRQILWGSDTNPYSVPLWEVIWSKGQFENAISYSPKIEYRQLNTTYVIGPDGMPWATGVARSSLENFWGQSPFQSYNTGQLSGNLEFDERLNSTDPLANLNTGLRNLERVDESVFNPTLEDIMDAVQEGFDSVVDAITEPSWTNYSGQSYGSGGWGGRGSPYRVNSPVRNDPTYGRSIPYIRLDNPYTRRATIRRERFSSDRGRLKPWQ